MDLKTTFSHNKEYDVNFVNDSVVIFEPEFREVYMLGTIEKHIWELCSESKCYGSILKILNDCYDNLNVKKDVDEFISMLLDKNIIQKKSA